jgi:hypothetical protein
MLVFVAVQEWYKAELQADGFDIDNMQRKQRSVAITNDFFFTLVLITILQFLIKHQQNFILFIFLFCFLGWCGGVRYMCVDDVVSVGACKVNEQTTYLIHRV